MASARNTLDLTDDLLKVREAIGELRPTPHSSRDEFCGALTPYEAYLIVTTGQAGSGSGDVTGVVNLVQLEKQNCAFHSLKATVVSPRGLMVQARKGYYAPKKAEDMAAQEKEDVQDAVFAQNEIQALPINELAHTGSPVAPEMVPLPIEKLAAGSYVMNVRARDSAQNVTPVRSGVVGLARSPEATIPGLHWRLFAAGRLGQIVMLFSRNGGML